MTFGRDIDYIIEQSKEFLLELADDYIGVLDRTVNAVLDIWEMDCAGWWTLYIRTGSIAAKDALWLLLTPSLGEILENYLEPKPGRRGGRRGQNGDRNRVPAPGGGSRVVFRGGIPDVDAQIAALIPGKDLVGGRRVGPGEFIFWTGINVADRVLWQFLLIEAAETFATHWQSGLLQSGQCLSVNSGSAQGKLPGKANFFSPVLWADKNSIEFLQELNLFVNNNSSIRTSHESVHGTWHVALDMWGELTGPGGDAWTTMEFVIQVYGTRRHFGEFLIKEVRQQITAHGDETSYTKIDVVHTEEGLNQVRFSASINAIENNGFNYIFVGGKFDVATRSVEVIA